MTVLAATALVVAGCTGDRSGNDDSGDVSEPADTGSMAWEPCPEVLDEVLGDVAPSSLIDQLAEQVSYECGTVAVPQDWNTPDAPETFDIALVRARGNSQQDPIGSLFINPGGPGASGIESAVYLSLGPTLGGLPSQVIDRFDLVGFDPRGVGKSSPVECYSDADLDEGYAAEPDPVAQAEFDEAVAEITQAAEACGAAYGDTLRLFSTRQAAHDLDALREAVGDEQITYLGYSYGTLLGAVYAHLFPENIRALVLDGAVDPQQDSVASSEEQAVGFERAMDNFTDWCAQAPDECPLQPDARTAIADALDAARSAPVPGDDGRDATAGWVFTAVISALYLEDYWQPLAAAIDQLDGGDATGVFDLADSYAQRRADGSYSNLSDAFDAINCADDDSDLTVAEVREYQEQWRAEYPMFGGPVATGLLGCVVWPGASDPYPVGPAEGAPPILVVGTLGDPATPYESTARLAELLGSGVVLTWEGEGHTAFRRNGCINDEVGAYLIDLTVPDQGTTCPA
jgi:pimeloyl-ACP methyl ester carboxylesterase